jgi:hypothetical protein
LAFPPRPLSLRGSRRRAKWLFGLEGCINPARARESLDLQARPSSRTLELTRVRRVRRPRRDRLSVLHWPIGLQAADATQPLSKVSLKPAKVSDARARLGEFGREPLFAFALLLGLSA